MTNANAELPRGLSLAQAAAHPDGQLVSAAKAGSEAAFADLQNLYARRLYNTIFRITRNREDAEDVLQDTFLHIYRALQSFEGRSTFYSWATRIAINSALMALRKRRVRPEVPFDLPARSGDAPPQFEVRDPSPSPEQIYVDRQMWTAILHSIHSLQPKLRETIRIRMARECSMDEIARTLGITVASVKSRLYRARLQLSARQSLANTVHKSEPPSRAPRQRLIAHLRDRDS
jgi:RNA polymerase sigma-70 factor (ECF subfamily)